MTRFTRCWASAVIRYRALVLTLTALTLILSPLSFQNLYHDDSIESYFLEHDPNLHAFNRLVELYGDNEYLLVGVQARPQSQDVFSTGTIQMIHELTEFLENHRHVTQVRSLSKYEHTYDDDGMLATDKIFEDVLGLREDDPLLEQARQIMAGQELALDGLLTRDFQHTLIAARSVYRPGENAHKVELVTDLIQFIDQQGYRDSGHLLHLSGVPVVGERFETLTQRDMAWINPVMTLIMIGILYAIFRAFFATMVPMLVIGCVALSTVSLQGWLHWPFTAVNSALIPTIIILSIGTSVHVLVEFFHFRRRGLDPQTAAATTIQDLLFPVFFTCLTTAFGFITLSVTELMPVRHFALLAASSAMLIFIFSMTSLPALLSYVPWIARGSDTAEGADASVLSKLLTRLPAITFTHRKTLVWLGAVITLFGAYSVSHITVDTNIAHYFKKNSWFYQDLNYFNEHFKGNSNLEVIIDTGIEGGVKNPALLQRADALQDYLESLPETGKANSILRFYKQISQALHHDDPAYFTLPTSPEMAAQFLLLYENSGPEEDLADLKDFDERFMRISIPTLNIDARYMTRVLNDIEQHIAEHFSDLTLDITGALVMNNAQNNYVNNGMFLSFSIAILVIGLCFMVIFRSLKYGLIALVPSVVPIILTGGLISMAGIPMDLGTMIVGAMTIGIAVDDAIHMMSRYLLRRQRGDTVDKAIRGALATSGKAVILTSIILVCGFSVMLFGSFVSYIYVGLFSAMIMSFALIGDLLFLPALLYLFDREKSDTQTVDTTATAGTTALPASTEEISHA